MLNTHFTNSSALPDDGSEFATRPLFFTSYRHALFPPEQRESKRDLNTFEQIVSHCTFCVQHPFIVSTKSFSAFSLCEMLIFPLQPSHFANPKGSLPICRVFCRYYALCMYSITFWCYRNGWQYQYVKGVCNHTHNMITTRLLYFFFFYRSLAARIWVNFILGPWFSECLSNIIDIFDSIYQIFYIGSAGMCYQYIC